MAEFGKPSVYVVDSHATRPALPPRMNQKVKHASAAQTILFMLVTLALFGMVIEACFIYSLYQSNYVSIICLRDLLQCHALRFFCSIKFAFEPLRYSHFQFSLLTSKLFFNVITDFYVGISF